MLPVEKIEEHIVNRYKNDFDESDGVWHDLFFTLADCEWKCGQLSAWLFKKVESVITSGSAVDYLRELDASENDLKTWEINLNKFLFKLKSSNPKPLTQKLKKPFVPPTNSGDVFAYKALTFFEHHRCEENGLYRAAICLYRYDPDNIYDKYYTKYCVAIANLESAKIPTVNDIKNAPLHNVAWYSPIEMMGKKDIKIIGNIKSELKADYQCLFGAHTTSQGIDFPYGSSDDFYGFKNNFYCEMRNQTNAKKIKELF